MVVMKYNPGFLTDDELVKSFCIRIPEFASIIEMLRECEGSSNPHRLVIGPRGYGKTNLLLRVAAEIRRNPELSLSFFPIVFAEESYRVLTADEFWLEALSLLAEQAPSLEDKDDLGLTFEELRKIRNDPALGKRCLGHLLDFSNRHGKRLVLIVENLNMMFRDMAEQDGGWKLRQTLQTEPRIILLASATSRFSEISSPDHAFYDLFVTRVLPPLSTEECATLWENVSGQCRSPEAMRGLRILTGGNPRLLSIVAQFGSRLSFRDLMGDLLKLIDDLTEYFRNHIEALPPQERLTYLALAELWEPAAAREVAVLARLDTNKCSAHLNRLVDRGVVEIVGGSARRKLYYLAERLYNIYYLLRRSRTPDPLIEALVRFMDAYYSPPELKDVGSLMVREAGGLEPERKTLHWTAFARLIDLPVLASYRNELLSIAPEEFTKNFRLEEKPVKTESIISTRLEAANLQPNGDISEQTTKEREKQALEDPSSIEKESSAIVQRQKEGMTTATGSILHRSEANDSSSPLEDAARATVDKGISFLQMHDYAEAIVTFEEVVRRFGSSTTPTIQVQVALALVNKGVALGELDQLDSELAAYEEVVNRFSDSSEPTLLYIAVNAAARKVFALGKWERLEEVVSACDELVERFGDSSVPQVVEQTATAYFLKGIKLNRLNRFEEAITACNKLVARFGDNDAPAICLLVAGALNNKAYIFNQLNQLSEKLSVCDEIIRRFGDSDEPLLIEQFAKAVLLKGTTLDELNRPTEAIAAYDEIVRQFGNSDAPVILEGTVAQALFDKGRVLNELNRLEEAIAVCDEIVQRFANSDTAEILEVAVQALFNKSNMLGRVNRFEEAIAICDEIVQRFGDNESPEIQKVVAHSTSNKNILLSELNRFEEAIAICDEIVQRFGDNESPEIQEVVAISFFRKGGALSELNRPDEAAAICDEIMHRFGDNESPEIQEVVARSLVNKSAMLARLNQLDEAIAICDEIMHRFGDNESPEIQEAVARSLFRKGGMLTDLNKPEEAIVACDEAVRRFCDSDVSEILEVVAQILVNKANALIQLNRLEDAVVTCDEVIRLFGSIKTPAILEAIAKALTEKAVVFIGLNRLEDAVVTCDEVVQRFGTCDAHVISAQVAYSLVFKGSALRGLDQIQEAKMAWEEVVKRFGVSENTELNSAVGTALLQIADSAREQGDLEEAMKAVEQVFDRSNEQASGYRCEGYLIRAQASVAAGNVSQAEDDIKEALALLPDFGFLLSKTIDVLMDFTVLQGAIHTNELIQASPSAEQLLPFTTALDKELGNNPRVAREIEEIAEDILEDLGKRRKNH